jgi:hypothetical protein
MLQDFFTEPEMLAVWAVLSVSGTSPFLVDTVERALDYLSAQAISAEAAQP